MTLVDTVAPALLCDDEVVIPATGVELAGHLLVPQSAVGLVVVSHGSGSIRHSARNRFLAKGPGERLVEVMAPRAAAGAVDGVSGGTVVRRASDRDPAGVGDLWSADRISPTRKRFDWP